MTNEELFKLLKQILAKLDHLQSTPVKTHLKTRDACEYLSVCENTLMKICIQNNIYPVKLSGLNYFALSELKSLFNHDKAW